MINPGQRIGGYTVVRPLGEGGQARAWEVKNGLRNLVLKVPHEPTRQLIHRLKQEADSMKALDHPNVVRVIDLIDVPGAEGPVPGLVMEYVNGETLFDWLQGDPAPEARLDVFSQVVEAVVAIHAKGIVHRDLSSTNVMVETNTSGVIAKVLDFGIARVPSGDRHTQDGMLGTPGVMSPEQMLNASKVDQRADIWALGVLLYEVTEGERPFREPDVLRKVVAGRFELPVHGPPWARELIGRCIVVDVQDRIQTAHEVLDSVKRGRQLPDRALPPARPSGRTVQGSWDVVGPGRPATAPIVLVPTWDLMQRAAVHPLPAVAVVAVAWVGWADPVFCCLLVTLVVSTSSWTAELGAVSERIPGMSRNRMRFVALRYTGPLAVLASCLMFGLLVLADSTGGPAGLLEPATRVLRLGAWLAALAPAIGLATWVLPATLRSLGQVSLRYLVEGTGEPVALSDVARWYLAPVWHPRDQPVIPDWYWRDWDLEPVLVPPRFVAVPYGMIQYEPDGDALYALQLQGAWSGESLGVLRDDLRRLLPDRHLVLPQSTGLLQVVVYCGRPPETRHMWTADSQPLRHNAVRIAARCLSAVLDAWTVNQPGQANGTRANQLGSAVPGSADDLARLIRLVGEAARYGRPTYGIKDLVLGRTDRSANRFAPEVHDQPHGVRGSGWTKWRHGWGAEPEGDHGRLVAEPWQASFDPTASFEALAKA